ncbi:MAG: tetratricopeptide repeat protein [Acidobacteria bacterium]|nr:tetratricopeptide repeat protein [Acidobacteriota bacterium]
MTAFLLFAFLAADTDQIAAAHDATGRAEFAAGRYRSAQKHFQAAMKTPGQSDASLAAVLANAAQAAFALEEYAEAETLTRRAAALAPDWPGQWQQLAQVLMARGKDGEAELALLQALSVRETAAVLSDLGVLAERRKRMAKALEYFTRAEVLAKPGVERARILANLGVARGRMGDKAGAVESLGRAVSELETNHPDLERVLWGYSEALSKLGRKAEAREATRRAESIRSAFAGQTNALGASVRVSDLAR